jgi:uncharacterized protein (DUF427 family)
MSTRGDDRFRRDRSQSLADRCTVIEEETPMKALVGDIVVAEADFDEVVGIFGYVYFPPQAVEAGALRDSATAYTCAWKGNARYHDVLVGDTVLKDAAWSYPRATEYAVDRVGSDFSGYVAFDARQVQLER